MGPHDIRLIITMVMMLVGFVGSYYALKYGLRDTVRRTTENKAEIVKLWDCTDCIKNEYLKTSQCKDWRAELNARLKETRDDLKEITGEMRTFERKKDG